MALGSVGALAAIVGALRWGNQYLDEIEGLDQDELAAGQFFTTSNGWRLHFTVQGEGEPIVLIHGFMDSLQSWRRNVDEWGKEHTVYAIDALGFGMSDRVVEPVYTLKQEARLLAEFFEGLGIRQAAIAGHSMGGALALQFAYDFPDQVYKLVLIAPATYLYDAYPRDGFRRVPNSVARGVLGIANRVRGNQLLGLVHAYGDPRMIDDDAMTYRAQLLKVRGSADALVAISKSRREADVPRGLKKIMIPTLLLWGERDRVVPLWHARRHYLSMPNARLELIEGAGHLPQEEKPQVVNQLVERFLQKDEQVT